MGTTTDKLNKLIQTKAAIKSAIEQKGGTLAANAPFADYADAIESIPQSGGSDADTIAKMLGATEANPVTINTGLDIDGTNTGLFPISSLNYLEPFFNIRGLVLNANSITLNYTVLRHPGGQGGSFNYGSNHGLFNNWNFTTANYPNTAGIESSGGDSDEGIIWYDRLVEGSTIGTVNITEPLLQTINVLLLGRNVKVTNAINVTGNNPTFVLSYGFAYSNIPSTFDFSQWEMAYRGHALYYCTTNRNALMINSNYIFTRAFQGIDAKIIKNIYTTAVPTLGNANAFDNDCQIYVPLSLYDDYIIATNWSAIKDLIVGMVMNTGTTMTINYNDANGDLIQAVTSNIAQYESTEVYVEDHTFEGYLHDGITEVLYNDGGSNVFNITAYPRVNRSITINYQDNNGNTIDTLTETVEVGDGGHNTILVQTCKVSNDVSYYYNTTLTVTEDNQIFNVTPLTDKVLVVKVAGGDYPSNWSVTKDKVLYYNDTSTTIGESDDTVMFRLAAANLPSSGYTEALKWRNSQKLTLNNANGSVIVYPAKILRSGANYSLSLSSTLTSSPISEYSSGLNMRFGSSSGTYRWTGNLNTDYTVSLGGSYYALGELYMFLAFRKSELNVDYILFDNGDGTITLQ